jgi:N6-adenosine-specific RNA methylase IME4
MDFPNKKYKIIYADPPWEYRDKASAGERGSCYKYKVQDINWTKSLEVSEISDKDSVLFLWVTMPMIPEGLSVINSWGFKYKTCAFAWVKRNKKSPSWFWGMGHWTRSNAELCLLAIKGKPKRIAGNVHQIIDTPIEFHSKKPDCVREKIVQLMGDIPRIELFARQKVDGWDYWGNEVKYGTK